MIKHFQGVLSLALLCSFGAAALAQVITPPAPAPQRTPEGQGTSSDQQLQQVVVTGANIPINEAIVPTVRPISAAYGLDLNVMEIPRNVTIISRAQLDDISVLDVRDFTKLTTSSFTTTNFGAPSNPSIRGQTADVFINGMREGLTSNGNGMPIDFNAFDSVDILKGPPGVVYGASNYVGGYFNFVTKQPYFDRLQGAMSATFGSYDQYRWNIDLGGPIIPEKLAFRISYSGIDSGSYYENQVTQTQSLFAALTWIPTDKYKLEVNVDGYSATYTENNGFNRPTQNLINNGQYFSGNVIGFLSGGAPVFGVPFPQNVQSSSNLVQPGGLVGLDRSIRLLRPGDGSYGKSLRGQAIQTFTINDNFSIVNNTFVQGIDRHTKDSAYYSEIIPEAFSFENRTELHINFDIPFGRGGSAGEPVADGKEAKAPAPETAPGFVLGNKINLGIDFHYQEVTAFDDFFDEPLNAWNLATSRNFIHYVNFSSFTSLPVPNNPGWTATPGVFNGDTNYSKIFTVAPFYEHVFNFGDHFSLLAGARADILWVKVNDPLYSEAAAAGNVNPNGPPGARASVVEPNFNVSPTFKPWKWLTTYFTYNYSQSYSAGNGGGFPAGDGLGHATIPVTNELHIHSDLYEAGAKASILGDTLFINAAFYQQHRINPGLGASFSRDTARGFEIEADYQPSRNFYVSAGYSYINSFIHGSPGFVAQVFPIDSTHQIGPNGTVITDNSATLPRGIYREPGVPAHAVNLLTKYEIPTSFGTFGTIFGETVTGPMFLGYGGYVRIPAQHEEDLTFFYHTKDDHFEAKIALLNLTNQKLWGPPNAVYGYDSVVAEWPFHVEGTITIKF
jgi:outer membrane receptor protein involved in Fe transport